MAFRKTEAWPRALYGLPQDGSLAAAPVEESF